MNARTAGTRSTVGSRKTTVTLTYKHCRKHERNGEYMEMKTIKKTKTELEIEVTGEDETILHPITHILLQNNDVEYAATMADNPMAPKKRLFLRVKKGSPEDVLKKAVKYLEDEVKQFRKNFE